jgi:hypothetical protein
VDVTRRVTRTRRGNQRERRRADHQSEGGQVVFKYEGRQSQRFRKVRRGVRGLCGVGKGKRGEERGEGKEGVGCEEETVCACVCV